MAHRVFLRESSGAEVVAALGIEFGCVYEIVSPRGARAVINDPSDRDFVGYLMGDDAVTGLEGGETRPNREDLAEADGSVQGDARVSGITFTLKGQLTPDEYASTVAQAKLKAAFDARGADGLLRWYPRSPGVPPVVLRFHQQQTPRFPGRRPKTFFLAGGSTEPLIFSQEIHTVDLAGGAGALAFNHGAADTPVELTIFGPTVEPPVLRNDTTGQRVTINRPLTAIERLSVATSPRRWRVLLNGARAGGLVAYLQTDELHLVSGPNVLRLEGGASGRVSWQDAWG